MRWRRRQVRCASDAAANVDVDRVRQRWPGVFAKSLDCRGRLATGQRRGSYTAFIHWPFQRENTPLGRAQEWDPDVHGPFDDSTNDDILRGRVVRMAGADEYLRMLAIARLYFDNIPSLQSSWVTMGPKVGQLALFFGANDMGSVMMEENVVSAAGTTYRLNEREICRLIRDAGWVPAQRDQYYNVLQAPRRPRRRRTSCPWRTRRCGTCGRSTRNSSAPRRGSTTARTAACGCSCRSSANGDLFAGKPMGDLAGQPRRAARRPGPAAARFSRRRSCCSSR